MPSEKKVDFKTYRQALDVFKQGELNKQTSVADKYKNAAALMKVAGKYLTDRGVDITKPFETEEILKGWKIEAQEETIWKRLRMRSNCPNGGLMRFAKK